MKEKLMQIGLEAREADVYIQLLKKPRQTATEIAKRTKINRTVVYSVLDKLIEKGLVSYILIKEKKHFSANNPRTLGDFLKDKERVFNEVLPALELIKENKNEPVKVEVFEGVKGEIAVLKDIIKEGKNYVSFGDDGSWIKISETLVEQYLRQIVEKGIREKVLLKQGTKLIGNLKNSEIRYLPKNLIMNTITTIYGDKVAISIFEEPYFIILIKSKSLANTYRSFFNILWKITKK